MTIPAWLGRLLGIGTLGVDALGSTLLLSGDTAHNPEADDARNRQIGADTAEYYRTHLWADPGLNGDVLGQGVGRRKVIPGLSSAEQKRRAQYVYDYYRQHGWSDPASLAPVANLQAESTFNDRADNGSHYGIGQWDANRQAAFRAVYGHDIRQSTFEEQVAFSEWELHNGDPKSVLAGRMMQAAKNPEDATRAYSHFNERPGSDADDNARALAAERLGSQLNRSGVPSDASSPQQSGTGNYGSDDTDHFGRVQIDITHRNPPPGTSLQATSDSGNVAVSSPKVMTAMPGIGGRDIARDGY